MMKDRTTPLPSVTIVLLLCVSIAVAMSMSVSVCMSVVRLSLSQTENTHIHNRQIEQTHIRTSIHRHSHSCGPLVNRFLHPPPPICGAEILDVPQKVAQTQTTTRTHISRCCLPPGIYRIYRDAGYISHISRCERIYGDAVSHQVLYIYTNDIYTNAYIEMLSPTRSFPPKSDLARVLYPSTSPPDLKHAYLNTALSVEASMLQDHEHRNLNTDLEHPNLNTASSPHTHADRHTCIHALRA